MYERRGCCADPGHLEVPWKVHLPVTAESVEQEQLCLGHEEKTYSVVVAVGNGARVSDAAVVSGTNRVLY